MGLSVLYSASTMLGIFLFIIAWRSMRYVREVATFLRIFFLAMLQTFYVFFFVCCALGTIWYTSGIAPFSIRLRPDLTLAEGLPAWGPLILGVFMLWNVHRTNQRGAEKGGQSAPG